MPCSIASPTSARLCRRTVFAAPLLLLGTVPASAQDPVFTVTYKDRQWEPATLEVPANQKIELKIVNTGTAAIEFESHDMRREKVVPAGQTVSVFIGPLRPGSYDFFNDFNKAARGRITAR